MDKLEINIEQIVNSKTSNRKLPKFLIKYLQRIVHEKDINDIFDRFGHLKNVEFIDNLFNFWGVSTEVIGNEKFPVDDKKYIFVSNHPLGGLDGMVLALILGKVYNNRIRLLVNDLLLYLKPLEEIFMPVNKMGGQGKKNAEIFKSFFATNQHLITFPAGVCSRKVKGRIVDLTWQKSFIAKSVEFQRDVVPVFFEGRNSSFFYNLANFRKFLRIKLNIEMMYLADEMFRQRGNHFKVYIGEPIPWQTFDKTKTFVEWAQWVKEKSYDLK